MMSRGVEQPVSNTITSALRGEFFNNPATRAEFMRLVNGH
jgi:GTP cyclohydrolase I